MTRGIIFLANDNVYELVIAFLNSLRNAEPNLPLCLIPFDENTDAVRELTGRYNFRIYDDAKELRRCDEISRALHGSPWGHYRKLLAWKTTFDEFIYVDVDTVILQGLSPVFQYLSISDFILGTSRMQSTRRWVWKPTITNSSILTQEQIEYAGNTALICSRRDALSLDIVEAKMEVALRLAAHMELRCFEQPLLNYLIVTSGQRYTSLTELRRSRAFPDVPAEVWAGMSGGVVHGGNICFPKRSNILLVHWAGQWRLKTERDRADDDPSNDTLMPYERLWQFYRNFPRRGEPFGHSTRKLDAAVLGAIPGIRPGKHKDGKTTDWEWGTDSTAVAIDCSPANGSLAQNMERYRPAIYRRRRGISLASLVRAYRFRYAIRRCNGPVLIVACPRSGTTALCRAMNEHSRILMAWGGAPMLKLIGEMAYSYQLGPNMLHFQKYTGLLADGVQARLRSFAFDCVWADPFRLLESARGLQGKRYGSLGSYQWLWGSKATPDECSSEGLEWLFPQVRFVYIVRNGIDVVYSMSRFISFREWSFERLCMEWASRVRRYDYLTRRAGSLFIRFEDFLANPRQTLTNVCSHISVRLEEPMVRFAQGTLVHPLDGPTVMGSPQIVLSSRAPAHENWSEAQKTTFRQVCGREMELLGYSVPF